MWFGRRRPIGDARGKSRRLHHGRLIFLANGEQRGMNVVGRYVGLVQNRIKNMSLLTVGVNLVPAGATLLGWPNCGVDGRLN